MSEPMSDERLAELRSHHPYWAWGLLAEVIRLRDAVAAETERCAKIAATWEPPEEGHYSEYRHARLVAVAIAAKIREGAPK